MPLNWDERRGGVGAWGRGGVGGGGVSIIIIKIITDLMKRTCRMLT